MEGSLGQKHKPQEFTLVSISELASSSSSSSSSSAPVVARFSGDSGAAELRFRQEADSDDLAFDLRTSQIFRLGPVQSVCISEGDASEEKSHSRGVTIQFRNVEESSAFHSVFDKRKKDDIVQGTTHIPNGEVSFLKSKFDDKIESSSAKMYFHYYGQLLHQQNMLQDYVRTGQILQTRVNRFKSDKNDVDTSELKGYSCDVKFTDKELDVIEMAVYGDVIRPGNQCRCRTVSEMLGQYKSKDRLAPCKLPYNEDSL